MNTTPHDVVIEQDGRVPVPADVADATGLGPGASVVLEPTEDGLFVRRRTVSEELDAEIDAGGLPLAHSLEELATALRSERP